MPDRDIISFKTIIGAVQRENEAVKRLHFMCDACFFKLDEQKCSQCFNYAIIKRVQKDVNVWKESDMLNKQNSEPIIQIRIVNLVHISI